MHLVIYLFTVCHISIILTVLNGYVLFAANIDDFKTIARKLVPGNLADQIADIAAPSSTKYKENPLKSNTEYYVSGKIKNKPTPKQNKDEYIQILHDKQSRKPVEHKYESYGHHNLKNEAKLNQDESKDETEQEEYDGQSKQEGRKSTSSPQEYEDEQVAGALRSRIENLVKNSATVAHEHLTSPQFDIDELVEKVKERLEKQFEERYVVKINSQKQPRYTTADYNNEGIFTKQAYKHYDAPMKNTKDYAENIDKFTTPIVKTSRQMRIATLQQNENQYGEEFNNENTNTPIMIFDKIKITAKKAKDSYEDYVIPAKDNIFESNEKLYKQSSKKERQYEKSPIKFESTTPSLSNIKISNRNDNVIKFSNHYDAHVENLNEEKMNYYDYGNTPDRYKAKTEHLSYDYRISTDKYGKGNAPIKIKKGTNIPTREHYKMSSPNYVAKIPVRAEKYDFNEPLPEKDREVEDMKYFNNPPAFINGRVVLRDGMDKK